MFEELVKALGLVLSLWDHHEKNKYQDELLDLERQHDEESNKSPELRSDARLDNLERELRLVARRLRASVGEQNPEDKS